MTNDDEMDPVDRATLGFLHVLSPQWSDYTMLAVTEPHERALDRLISAGLTEADGVVAFTQLGSATRLVVEGRWSGRVLEAHVHPVLASVPEWFENGRLVARVANQSSVRKVRLTTVGITAQNDIRSPNHQHIVLRLLRNGAAEDGRLTVDVQRIERPLDGET